MKISYGITVHNEAEELQKLLQVLNKNIDKEDEIVVCVDGDDEKVEAVLGESLDSWQNYIVYKRKLEPTIDFVGFSAFVSFFPQLVAGPIERATKLLPQFYSKRTFDYTKAVDGMRQILWGLFKKIVIADNCAEYANLIFNNSADYSGSTLVLGALFFTFQIYGDFSGYSDIAIGTSRLFGFNLMRNFNFPYFSRDIAEFWRRWHISLSTWLRDYLYIPLGGSRGGTRVLIFSLMGTMLLGGLWHGASWNFVLWGLIHGLLLLAHRILSQIKMIQHLFSRIPKIMNITSWIITQYFIFMTWLIK